MRRILYAVSHRLLLFAFATAVPLSALAQTKIAATIDCDKAEPRHVIPIPDRQGFAFVISQYKCTWPKSVGIAGAQSKDFVNTSFNEAAGPSVQSTAMGVSTFDSGDKTFSRSTGRFDLKAGTITGKWTYTGGTGKLSGIKGGGTYFCKVKGPEPGVGYSCDIKGNYTLATTK